MKAHVREDQKRKAQEKIEALLLEGGRATQKWGLDGGIVSGHGFSRAETRRR